jgi:hypothetical protein
MRSVSVGVLAMVACLCYYFLRSNRTYFKSLIWSIYSIILLAALYFFVVLVIYRIQTPEIWDFTAFYLYGKVAAGGYNFYQPENFHIVFESANLPFTHFGALVEEVVNVGFPYPPPTILYFMPLGFLSYYDALTAWTIFNLLFVIGTIYLIYSMFFKYDKLNGLMLVTILYLISSQVRSTISCSQTNLILLFLLLLMKNYSSKSYAGIFLALAFLTKPYMLIFGLYFVITHNWKAIAHFLASSFILVGLTAIIFGKETLLSYFYSNSTQRLPKWVYSEQINQSLHAVLLRANLISIDKPYVYVSIALGILSITLILLVYLNRRKQNSNIWFILLLTGLLIYPGTLSYYGALLLFVIFQIINLKEPLNLNKYSIIAIIGLFYYLNSVSVFFAICFLMIVVLIISFNQYLPFWVKALLTNNQKDNNEIIILT